MRAKLAGQFPAGLGKGCALMADQKGLNLKEAKNTENGDINGGGGERKGGKGKEGGEVCN